MVCFLGVPFHRRKGKLQNARGTPRVSRSAGEGLRQGTEILCQGLGLKGGHATGGLGQPGRHGMFSLEGIPVFGAHAKGKPQGNHTCFLLGGRGISAQRSGCGNTRWEFYTGIHAPANSMDPCHKGGASTNEGGLTMHDYHVYNV